ncbi:unnamed protein product [Prorocentrum cordatum]|uniref:Glycerophosphocholine acyltransferase 1 n=1 Tax=Prorocentrum cordatum TaxID=2364126 RepID=A0ABN9X579_9DINO|nr:unnamed protein product [Polarella glacialis]
MTDSDDKLARVPIVQSDGQDVESVAWLLLTIAPHCCATASEARKQRWLLRTAHSLVAICLYAASMWIQTLTQQVWLDFALVFIFMPLYHLTSRNGAGGYYNTFLEQFTELPQHLRDIRRRFANDGAYQANIERERESGTARTVNAVESGILFLGVKAGSLLLAATALGCHRGLPHVDRACGRVWLALEAVAFCVVHRTVGANVFRGSYGGLIQPEGMWKLSSVRDPGTGKVTCTAIPLEQHPDPSY